ncbi:hypothetical protein HOC13_01830 [Candidatus Woesearchaeota archaeon]|mgnify:CR=1 FL=1|jgi:hypothetical protein|nr:hypothetical protein [Candidatus Woesearchaeota archaeon]
MKKLLSILALFVVALIALPMVMAAVVPVEVVEVEINDNEVDGVFAIQEGEDLEIQVKLEASEEVEDVQVEVELADYDYADYDSSVEDETNLFDMKASKKYYKTLNIYVPKEMDSGEHDLKITVSGDGFEDVTTYVTLEINPSEHNVDMEDVIFSPGLTVKAGQSVWTTVLLENNAEYEEEVVKVTVAVPELGIQNGVFVALEAEEDEDPKVDGDSEATPEIFLKIPANAEAKDYLLVVNVKYDKYATETKEYVLTVLEGEQKTQDKLILTVGPETQNVVAGQQAAFPVALTNAGANDKSYVLELSGDSSLTTSLSENLVVLESGKTKVVYAYVTATANEAAEKVATLAVKADGETLKTIELTANVVPAEEGNKVSLRNGLEIALIVLVVLLVIIGLILGFSRMKKDDNNEEDQTYY